MVDPLYNTYEAQAKGTRISTGFQKLIVAFALLAVCSLLFPDLAQACPSCYGDPDSNEVKGLTVAITALLGITGSVLAAFAAFFLHVKKRAKQIEDHFAAKGN